MSTTLTKKKPSSTASSKPRTAKSPKVSGITNTTCHFVAKGNGKVMMDEMIPGNKMKGFWAKIPGLIAKPGKYTLVIETVAGDAKTTAR